MKAILQHLWYEAFSSFWFLPLMIVLLAVILSFITLTLDRSVFSSSQGLLQSLFENLGPQASQTFLSAIATAMVTIAGLVVPIAFIVLQLAAQQYGARLIRTFMRVRVIQLSFGIYLATFIYSLLILVQMPDDNPDEIPYLSVLIAILLALASVGVLVIFIHRVANLTQPYNIVANVAKDLHKTAEKFYALDLGQDAIKQEHPASDGEVPNEQQAYGLPATSPGYVEKINYKELLAVARRSDILVRLETRPGEFVVAGDRLALIWPSSRVDNRLIKDLSRLFTIGTERSTEIDVEFPVEELLEMSDRVLTENINDLFIASTCLDWLKECLTVMMHKPERASDFIYADGKLRIIVKPYRVSELIDYIFEVFWNSARNNQGIMPIMSEYILEAIAYLAPYAERDEERQVLKTHAEAVGTVLREKTLQDYEKKRIRSQYARTMQALMRGPGKAGSPSPQQDAIIHA